MIFLCDYYNQASKDLALFRQQATMPQQLSSIRWLSPQELSPFTYYVEAAEKQANHAFSTKSLCQPLGNFGNNQMARV